MRLDMPPVYRVPGTMQHDARRVGTHIRESFLIETQDDLLMPVTQYASANVQVEFALIDLTHPGHSEIPADRMPLLDDGWLVLRPMLQGFAIADTNDLPIGDLSADELALRYFALGSTYAGQVITDLIRLLDHLDNDPGVAEPQVVILADESTSEIAAWVTALDQRIRAAAITLWPSPAKRDWVAGVSNVPSNVPKLLNAWELSAPLAVLRAVAPRPLLLTSARQSAAKTDLDACLGELHRLYAMCDRPDAIQTANSPPSAEQISRLLFLAQ